MKTINFKWCIIGYDFIEVYTNDTNISYRPAFDTLVVDGSITIDTDCTIVHGSEVITHLYFERVYVKDLSYVPEKKDIKYTLFRKRPYVSGWVEDSERQKFSRTFINYKINIR